jgi:bifunctional non-homologous end joining protein LigD
MSPTTVKRKKSTETVVKVEGKKLTLSNLNKVLFPSGFTKSQMINYYINVVPAIIPHLANRPLTLKRYPDGTTGDFFYEKECPYYRPQWLEVATVARDKKSAKEKDKKFINYCVIDSIESMVWILNLATIEFHTLLSHANDVERPTMMVFDLDPGAPADFKDCVWAALELREILHQMGLECFPKTSGGKGLHLYIPFNTKVHFDQTKVLAHALALLMEKKYPNRATANMSKAVRHGKIFIDWSQNDEHKTTVTPYSLRAKDKPMVSTPVTWKEIERFEKDKDLSRVQFEAEDVVKRVKKHGDLFSPVLELKQKLPNMKDLQIHEN